jgi:hypothetical protein
MAVRPVVSAGLVTSFLVLLAAAAVAAAAPAAAVDDPSRPDGRVTHGPSCRPGGLVVEVVAGTAPYSVRLATTRTPSGEDEAVLEPGETVVLRTDDVDWGETIDGRLEYAAGDGSGTTFVDELEEYSFTRPTREDCEAIALPTTPEPVPPSSSPSSSPPTSTPGDASGDAGGGQAPPSRAPSPGPTPATEPRPSGSAVPAPPERPAGSAVRDPDARGSDARKVSAGGTVTLQASGFLPGEQVTLQLHGSGAVLATATAGSDGSVQTEVRIPARTAVGRATVDVVGDDSAVVAPVQLQVAGTRRATSSDGLADLVPLSAAAVALVGTVAALVSTVGRQRSTARGRMPIRSV